MRNKDKSHKHSYMKKKIYIMYPIGKASSTTSFSSDDAFLSISLSAKKLELFINKTFY